MGGRRGGGKEEDTSAKGSQSIACEMVNDSKLEKATNLPSESTQTHTHVRPSTKADRETNK